MDKKTSIKYGACLVAGIVLVLLGRSYFGAEQLGAVCVLTAVAFLLGAYLGATKSKSLTRRIDRDNDEG